MRQKLLNLARREQKVFDVVLVEFGLERLIYRLSISPHKDKFVLKGGMLVTLWTRNRERFTRDVDFLCIGSSDQKAVAELFRETLAIDGQDGLVFDIGKISASAIREDQIHGGVRLRTNAWLGTTKIPMRIDIGFGDALTAPEYEIRHPSLLDLPSASIRAYSPATVMAEKFEALVVLGLANSRIRDYFDLWIILEGQDIGNMELANAIHATFARRGTAIPRTRPQALTPEFADDPAKRRQWTAFAASIALDNVSLNTVTDAIWKRLHPVCTMVVEQLPPH